MPPFLALLIGAIPLVVLLRRSKGSPALWLPVTWLFLVSTRSASQWLGMTGYYEALGVTASEEGSPLDRMVYLAMAFLAVWILARRKIKWSELFAHNSALVLFLLFALASVAWSDYPYVSLKRYTRDFTMYVVVLVILTDPRPRMAVVTVIRRYLYIVIILSFLLIRYYTQMGIRYSQFDGSPEYVGATWSKNMLGALCMMSGLFHFWDTLAKWRERKTPQAKFILGMNLIVVATTLSLFRYTQSATAQGCLAVGCLVIMIVRSKWVKVNPSLVTLGFPVAITTYFLLTLVFDLRGMVAGFLGRDPTLTGRTDTWAALLQLQTNPLLGLGYQSLWTGNRLGAILKSLNASYLNEAHNGYLETYLNLGVVGLFLLIVVLVSCFRNISKQLTVSPHFASFGIAVWFVLIIYNVTETAFGSTHLMGVLLLCAVVVPRSDLALSEETELLAMRESATAVQTPVLLRRSVIRERTSSRQF